MQNYTPADNEFIKIFSAFQAKLFSYPAVKFFLGIGNRICTENLTFMVLLSKFQLVCGGLIETISVTFKLGVKPKMQNNRSVCAAWCFAVSTVTTAGRSVTSDLKTVSIVSPLPAISERLDNLLIPAPRPPSTSSDIYR